MQKLIFTTLILLSGQLLSAMSCNSKLAFLRRIFNETDDQIKISALKAPFTTKNGRLDLDSNALEKHTALDQLLVADPQKTTRVQIPIEMFEGFTFSERWKLYFALLKIENNTHPTSPLYLFLRREEFQGVSQEEDDAFWHNLNNVNNEMLSSYSERISVSEGYYKVPNGRKQTGVSIDILKSDLKRASVATITKLWQ